MDFTKTPESRPAIKKRPLPEPGDSLVLEGFGRSLDILWWAIVPMVVFIIASMEWLHYMLKWPPSPWVPTIALVVVSAVAAWRCRDILRNIRNITAGIRGERTVGRMLHDLQDRGYRVYHDLEEDGYNIDHVLIGPGGVFAVETKNRSKPRNGQIEIVYDGQTVTLTGRAPDAEPVNQARASARSLRKLIKAQTGQDCPVQAVLLYPGWWAAPPKDDCDVYVANPEFFLGSFGRRRWPQVLSPAQIAALAAGIERYQRKQ